MVPSFTTVRIFGVGVRLRGRKMERKLENPSVMVIHVVVVVYS